MPLSINVGLSRKASRDYQSTGVSINVTAELDQSLLAKPDELQRQVADLYAQANRALDRQAGIPPAPARQPDRHNGNGTSRENNGNGHGGSMTESQHRAIQAIAKRLSIDPETESQDQFGTSVDELNIRQASELIDYLKGLESHIRHLRR